VNPLGVITGALQAIPPKARQYVLLAYSLTVVVLTILQLVGLDWDWDMIWQVLVLLGGYLGFQSAANVTQEAEGARKMVDDSDTETVDWMHSLKEPEEDPDA
jgi:uncharacterized membrane protein